MLNVGSPVRGELRNEITASFKKISEALKNLPTLKRFDEQARDEVKIARPATTVHARG
jgi:hypothetical protein